MYPWWMSRFFEEEWELTLQENDFGDAVLEGRLDLGDPVQRHPEETIKSVAVDNAPGAGGFVGVVLADAKLREGLRAGSLWRMC